MKRHYPIMAAVLVKVGPCCLPEKLRMMSNVSAHPIVLSETIADKSILALVKLGQTLTSSLELDVVLQRVLTEVTQLLNAEGVAILMLEDQELEFVAVNGSAAENLLGQRMPRTAGVVGHVMATGEPAWLNTRGSSVPGLRIYRAIESVSSFHTKSLLAAPLMQEGEVIGVLEAAHSDPDGLRPEDLPVLSAASTWAAIAIRNAQLHAAAQEAREERAMLEERARLARELHDAVTQSLYSMAVLSAAWRRQIAARRLTPEAEHIEELGELALQALREVRLLIYELRPAEFAEEGLIGALHRRLEAVEGRAGLSTRLIVTDENGDPLLSQLGGGETTGIEFYQLPLALESELFRIAQEALNNVIKHASAGQVTVSLRVGPRELTLEIADDGRGFDTENAQGESGGFGLTSMRERAERLGGQLDVHSCPGKGTRVVLSGVPLPA